MTKLIGKFVIHHHCDDRYRLGEVIDLIGTFVLVQFDTIGRDHSPPVVPAEFINLEEVTNERDQARWGFFDTREDRQKFIDWMNTLGEEGKVTPLNLVK